MMVASVIAPMVSKSIGSRLTMALGIFFGALGLIFMAMLVTTTGGYFMVLPGILAMGLGMGFAMTPSTEAITSALPKNRQGVASAVNDVTRELGTALGVALLGAVVTAGYSNAISNQLTGFSDSTAAAAREGIANALEAAQSAGSQSDLLTRVAQDAFLTGWQQAMWIGVAILALLFVYVLARGPISRK